MADNRIEIPVRWGVDGVDASASANGESMPERVGYLHALAVQVAGTFTADVTVEAKLTESMPFDALDTLGPEIFVFPYDISPWKIRLVVTNYASGTITAVIVGRTART